MIPKHPGAPDDRPIGTRVRRRPGRGSGLVLVEVGPAPAQALGGSVSAPVHLLLYRRGTIEGIPVPGSLAPWEPVAGGAPRTLLRPLVDNQTDGL